MTGATKQIAANRKALERSEKRISELKRLFIKIYEDNASGKCRQHIHIQYDCLGFIPLIYCFTTPRHYGGAFFVFIHIDRHKATGAP